MTPSPDSPLRIGTLAELLDGRPDTREMISNNLELAHACLELKQGSSDSIERILEQAKSVPSPELENISTCIRAEVLRLAGRESEAWDMAEELVAKDRFNLVASLYLRFLFPTRAASTSSTEIPPPPLQAEPAIPTNPVVIAPPVLEKASEEASVVESSLVGLHDTPSQTFHDPDSQVSLTADHDPSNLELPEIQSEFPPEFSKISQEESIRLLRLRSPDGSMSEIDHSATTIGDLDEALLDPAARILQSLAFGRILHAGFEGTDGAAHVWCRSGRTLYLVVGNSASAPALAARCSRAMEDLA